MNWTQKNVNCHYGRIAYKIVQGYKYTQNIENCEYRCFLHCWYLASAWLDNPWQHYRCFSFDIVWPCLTYGNCMNFFPRLHRWRTGPRSHTVEAVQLTPRQRLLWPYLRRPTSGRKLFKTIRNYPLPVYKHTNLQTNKGTIAAEKHNLSR